jgi:hypothetical protein
MKYNYLFSIGASLSNTNHFQVYFREAVENIMKTDNMNNYTRCFIRENR